MEIICHHFIDSESAVYLLFWKGVYTDQWLAEKDPSFKPYHISLLMSSASSAEQCSCSFKEDVSCEEKSNLNPATGYNLRYTFCR